MDERSFQMMMSLIMAAQGGGLPGYESGGGNPWDYYRMATLMPEQDSFFGPIGNMLAGMIPGLTTTGIDGNPTPVFKTNFRMQPSNLTGLQGLYAQQNAKAYGAAQRSHNAALTEAAGKFGTGLSAAAAEAGLPPWAAKLGDLFQTEAGAGMAQGLVNSMLGYDRGVAVNVANAKSPFMAASYMRNVGLRDNMEMTGHPEAMEHPVGDIRDFKGGTENVASFFNPFDEKFTDVRRAMASLAAGTTDKLMWDGLIKKEDVHGASEQYVAEIVSDALASGKVNLGGDESLDLVRLAEEQRTAQTQVDDINNRRSDNLDEMGVNQLRDKISAAKQNGDERSAEMFQLQLDKVLEEQLKPATKALEDVSRKAADGIRPLVEAVTGVTDSLRDFYGSEDEAKRALNELTGGQGTKDKAVADRMRDRITEVKALGAMAGLDPAVTGDIFKTSAAIAGGIGGSRLGRHGGTGAEATAWSADLIKGILGMGMDPERTQAVIRAHAAGQESWNHSRGKKALTMLEHAREQGLFEGGEESAEYQEFFDLMSSGSQDDMDEAIRRFGKKYFGSTRAFEEFIANDQNVATAYASLSEKGRDTVARQGVLARGREMDRARNGAGYTVQQDQQRMALREAGISETEIDNAVTESDFNAIREFLSGNAVDGNGGRIAGNKTALDLYNREYEAALKKVGGNPDNPETRAKAERIAMSNFQLHGGYELVEATGGPVQLDLLQNYKDINRTNRMYGLDLFDMGGGRLGSMSVKKGGFFSSVGAADEDNKGLTRSSMSESINDMVRKVREMSRSGVARTKDGEALTPEMVADFEKRKNELMKAGRYSEAQDLTEDFFSRFDNMTRTLVTTSGKNNTYRSVGNIKTQRDALKGKDGAGANDIAMDEKQSKIMAGLEEDDRRELLRLYNKRNRFDETTPEGKAEMEETIKKIRELEDKSKAAQRSDAENVIGAIQNQDWAKVFEVFKHGNATMEDFFKAIRRIISWLDGTAVSSKESAEAARTAGASSEARRAFLEGDTSIADRLELAESPDAAKSYLTALNGRHVRERKIEGNWRTTGWREYMAKAAKGDRSAYTDALDLEASFLDTSRKALVEEQAKYEKEAGGRTVGELEKRLSQETDPKKKDKLEKQLSAARQRDAAAETISSIDARAGRIREEKADIGKMSDTQFKELVQRAKDETITYRDETTTYRGEKSVSGHSGASNGDISGLLEKLERLCVLMQQQMGTNGSN